MTTQNPLYKKWLQKAKQTFPTPVRDGRLDRFVAAVELNPAFQSIYKAVANGTKQQANQLHEVSVHGGPTAYSYTDESTQVVQPDLELLFEAAKMGCFATIMESLRHRVNQPAQGGITALHVAVEYGNYEDVQLLLQVGAEVRADSKGVTPLHVAAASCYPNPEIAKLLVEHMKSRHESINVKIPETSNNESTRGNTALHFAADNDHISREFIETLADIDPTIKNTRGETAFHVAATVENPDVIVWMLEVFIPGNYWYKMQMIDSKSLMEMFAKRGDAKTVALLIKHGADISEEVLFQLIDESVKNPTKTDKLIDVYRTITENCVLWDWLKKTCTGSGRHECYPLWGTEQQAYIYRDKQREIMLGLLTKPSTEYDDKNVIEHAILIGDKVFLNEIVNTPHVFKFATKGNEMDYDITRFLHSQRKISKKICHWRSAKVEPKGQIPVKLTPYLKLITQNEKLWENTDILQLEPFYALTRSMCVFVFVQLLYFAMGLVQMVHMILFSVMYMRSYCSLNNQLNSNFSAKCNSSIIPPDPYVVNVPDIYRAANVLMLLLPTAIFFTKILFIWHLPKNASFRELLDVYATVPYLFPPFLWGWFFSTFEAQQFNLSLTSVVFLLGWLLTLSFFIYAFENASIFLFLVKDIIVKDILFSFGVVIIFVLVSFASAIHLLRTKALIGERFFFDTLYNVFASALTTGDFMDETSLESADDMNRIHLLRALFAIYLCCATIILLNILISMMNNRYEEARKKAKNIWTFHAVRSWICVCIWCRFFPENVLCAFCRY